MSLEGSEVLGTVDTNVRQNKERCGLHKSKLKQKYKDQQGFQPPNLVNFWGVQILLGGFVAFAALYFPNIALLSQETHLSFSDLQVPIVSTASAIGIYAVLGTIIVALAFSRAAERIDDYHDVEEAARRVQENSVILLVAQLVSIFSVSIAVVYVLGRVASQGAATDVQDILAAAGMLSLAALVSLIGSLVRPTREHFTAQSRVRLPANNEKLKNLKIDAYKSVGQRPERQMKVTKRKVIAAHITWPISVIMLSFVLIYFILGEQRFSLIPGLPYLFLFLFYISLYVCLSIASAGGIPALSVIRWVSAILLLVNLMYVISLFYQIRGQWDAAGPLALGSLVSFTGFLLIVCPWICACVPVEARRKSPFIRYVYFSRLWVFGELIYGLKRHIDKQEKQLALYGSTGRTDLESPIGAGSDVDGGVA